MSEPTENDPLDFLSGNAPELSGPSDNAPKSQNKPSRPAAPINKPIINPAAKSPGALRRPQMPMPGKPQSEQPKSPSTSSDISDSLDELPELPSKQEPAIKQSEATKPISPTVARVFFQGPKQPTKSPAPTPEQPSIEPKVIETPEPELEPEVNVEPELPATPPPLPTTPTPAPVTPIERPAEPPVLPLDVEEDIEEAEFDPEADEEFEHIEPDAKKTKFRFPAWLIVVLVLVVAVAGFVVVYPIIPNLTKGEGEEEADPIVATTVPAPTVVEPTAAETPLIAQPVQEEQDVDLFSDSIESDVPESVIPTTQETQIVDALPEELQPVTSIIPVQMAEFLVPLAGLDFQSNEVGSGSFKQLGTLTDGNHVIVVGVMSGTFDNVVNTMSQRALDSARNRGNNPTLSGPNRLGNAKLTSNLFTVMEGEDSNKEVRTYLIVEGSETNLILGTQSSAANAGYGLSKFITIASDITSK